MWHIRNMNIFSLFKTFISNTTSMVVALLETKLLQTFCFLYKFTGEFKFYSNQFFFLIGSIKQNYFNNLVFSTYTNTKNLKLKSGLQISTSSPLANAISVQSDCMRILLLFPIYLSELTSAFCFSVKSFIFLRESKVQKVPFSDMLKVERGLTLRGGVYIFLDTLYWCWLIAATF